MNNSSCPPKQAIDFIASGETVVTSSYHGVYWAQLMGRKVICIPFNDKFTTFQHAPTIAESDNWPSHVRRAMGTQPLLDEYRALNISFAQKVEGAWRD